MTLCIHGRPPAKRADQVQGDECDICSVCPEDGSIVVARPDDDFVAWASKCTSQYDRTCRVLATEVLERRADVERLRAALTEAIAEYQDAIQYKGAWLVEKDGDRETLARLRKALEGT